ncbi:hypothetical protein [Mixta intestinalis]|uniref:hypothetical protein n=1 Tax=Mixta intestinalis TaxID=1615494 RepID=UPI0013643E3F|nr:MULTISPECIES: hypothetical protein [Mixta]
MLQTRTAEGLKHSAQEYPHPLTCRFDRHRIRNDPFKNINLNSKLDDGDLEFFAIRCKSLRIVQTPADDTSPAAARADGLICAKILLQKFLDPNSAGGCGVAPFPSRIRFRLRSVASSAGRD